jgi:hypothetical protein
MDSLADNMHTLIQDNQLDQIYLQSIGFSQTIGVFDKPAVIESATNCLAIMSNTFSEWHLQNPKISPSTRMTEVVHAFLAAYLVIVHPRESIDHINDETRPIFNTTLKLVQRFESIAEILLHQPSVDKAEKWRRLQLAGVSDDFVEVLLDNHVKINTWKVIDPQNMILKIIFNRTRHTEYIDEQDPINIDIRPRIRVLRTCIGKIGGRPRILAFDAIMAKDMQARRRYFILQQEWARNRNPEEADSQCFDFVNI